METTNQYWQKNGDYEYLFHDQGNPAVMKLQPCSAGTKAEIFVHQRYYTIQRSGFWTNNLEMRNLNHAIVLKASPGKGCSNKMVIEFSGRIYESEIRNNPLAEFLISIGGSEQVSYSLINKGGSIGVLTKENTVAKPDPLLHFFLWFLFLPVAQENCTEAVHQEELAC